jgi:hypothetical protein
MRFHFFPARSFTEEDEVSRQPGTLMQHHLGEHPKTSARLQLILRSSIAVNRCAPTK